MTTYVLYHRDTDGRAAAYAIWKKLFFAATYIEVQYGEPFPALNLTSDDTIYIVDFSYDRDILEKIHRAIKKLMIFDHHESSFKKLEGFEPYRYDATKSSALATWEYFHPNIPVPHVITLVNDYDIWAKQFVESDALEEGVRFFEFGNNWGKWDKLCYDDILYNQVIRKGYEVIEHRNRLINMLIKTPGRVTLVNWDGKRCALYNGFSYVPKLAEAIYSDPTINCDFTCDYRVMDNGKMVFSFRSDRSKDTSVLPYAAKLGGGGHKNAAGSSTSLLPGAALIAELYRNPC